MDEELELGASMQDIARHIGLSDPGMLHHFPTKAALLGAVIDGLEAGAQDILNRTDALCANPDTLTESIASLGAPSSQPIRPLARRCADAVAPDYPARYGIPRLRRVHEHIVQICMERLQERGDCRSGVDPEFVARTAVTLLRGLGARDGTVRRLQGTSRQDDPGMALRSFL